jgi:hypothetical protein
MRQAKAQRLHAASPCAWPFARTDVARPPKGFRETVRRTTAANMSKKYPTTTMCDGEFLEMFEPTTRDSDVFIATAAKCGQTWLQTLLFHLKTRGTQADLGGQGLLAHSPWLELPADSSLTEPMTREEKLAKMEALTDPRIFKLHVRWDEVPRPPGSGAQVVTITRDPRDVPFSMFSHLRSMTSDGEPLAPESFDDYFEEWMEFGFYFDFLRGFWPHHDDEDVLWLCYEQMQTDLRAEVDVILDFFGWELEEEEIDRVLPLVSFGHMQKTEDTNIFGGSPRRERVWVKGSKFVREGGVGKNRARLSPEQEQRIVARCHEELEPACCDFVLRLPERDS